MPRSINPIDQPLCLTIPERSAPSSWTGHVPFAMWITSVLRPRLFVELGTFRGMSYCAFCQSIDRLGLPTRAVAIDTWRGDPHNGLNGPEVLAELRLHHDHRYGSFSTLLEMTFDQAAARFQDEEVDLLHIDGYHTYEAVRHDYETWRSKMSDRGVILFHDVVERIRDFGVWKFWEEIRTQYPSFEFHHEHGLGVLAVGRELPAEIRELVGEGGDGPQRIRTFFQHIGRQLELLEQVRELTGRCSTMEVDLALLGREVEAARSEGFTLARRCEALERDLLRAEQERVALERSFSWRLARRIAGLGDALKSCRR
ncbi:MAG: class I SAM-dependent methyltransferase [Isosphaerales bacterium]